MCCCRLAEQHIASSAGGAGCSCRASCHLLCQWLAKLLDFSAVLPNQRLTFHGALLTMCAACIVLTGSILTSLAQGHCQPHDDRQLDQHGQGMGWEAVPLCCAAVPRWSGQQPLPAARSLGAVAPLPPPHSVPTIPSHSPLDSQVVAYEPVWAIGTGVVATPEQAQVRRCAALCCDVGRACCMGRLKTDPGAHARMHAHAASPRHGMHPIPTSTAPIPLARRRRCTRTCAPGWPRTSTPRWPTRCASCTAAPVRLFCC